jgi:hypothetical protein
MVEKVTFALGRYRNLQGVKSELNLADPTYVVLKAYTVNNLIYSLFSHLISQPPPSQNSPRRSNCLRNVRKPIKTLQTEVAARVSIPRPHKADARGCLTSENVRMWRKGILPCGFTNVVWSVDGWTD